MERWWPAQYFVSSGIDGERSWRMGGKSSGENALRDPLHNLLENLLNAWPVLSFHWPDPWHKEDWGQRTLTRLSTLKYTQQLLRRNRQWNLQNTLGSSPCQSSSMAPTATHLFTEGSRKQETRDCKGIKILLSICPSSHRGEDFLP